MRHAFKSCFRIVSALVAFAFTFHLQPAAAQQFNDTVAFTITDSAGETAVSPGCLRSHDWFGVWRGSLPKSDYHCSTEEDVTRGVAAYYAPYAIQAALAYYNIYNQDSLNHAVEHTFPHQSAKILGLLERRGWKFDAPENCIVHHRCGSKDYKFEPSGLAYHVWTQFARGECRERSIVFRGTVPSIESVGSDLHSFFTSYDSEYAQLERNFNGDLQAISVNGDLPVNSERVQRVHCRQLVTVGHSLGGGLAQLVALNADPVHQIAKVVTFNSSPITGEGLVRKDLLNANKIGLTIDRVNQEGEILSWYPAKAKRQTRASRCDPLIRAVEFNDPSLGWVSSISLKRAIQNHKMEPLMLKLVALSYKGGVLVKAIKPAFGTQGCNTQYEEEQEEELVARINQPNRYPSTNTGFAIAQPSQYGPLYAYAADRDGKLNRVSRPVRELTAFGKRVKIRDTALLFDTHLSSQPRGSGLRVQ